MHSCLLHSYICNSITNALLMEIQFGLAPTAKGMINKQRQQESPSSWVHTLQNDPAIIIMSVRSSRTGAPRSEVEAGLWWPTSLHRTWPWHIDRQHLMYSLTTTRTPLNTTKCLYFLKTLTEKTLSACHPLYPGFHT